MNNNMESLDIILRKIDICDAIKFKTEIINPFDGFLSFYSTFSNPEIFLFSFSDKRIIHILKTTVFFLQINIKK